MLGYLRPEKFRVGIVLESSELASSPKVQIPHRPLRFHFDHHPRLGAPRSALRAAPRRHGVRLLGEGLAFLPLLRAASRVLCPGDCML